MIRIWLWEVPLPPELQFLANPLGSAAATLAFWLLLALLLQFVVLRVLKAIARRTDSEVEDVVVDVSRRPLVLLILILGINAALNVSGIDDTWLDRGQRGLTAVAVAVAAYWIWRLFKEVAMYHAAAFARRSDSRLDDVLVPIINQFVPVGIILIAGAVIVQNLGLNLSAVLVAIGGAAFIMAFALQDILSNVFAGIALLVDTPFRYGDLIKLEDGKVCQVMKIGLRVTHLYDTGEHAVIYMPNGRLANERLVNLMQPTPELVSVVPLPVEPKQDVERIRSMMSEVLDGHPDLLGEVEAKLQRLEAFATLSPEKRAHGAARLRAEALLDRAVSQTIADLQALSAAIRAAERRGLSDAERAELQARFEPLAVMAGALADVEGRLDESGLELEAFIDSVASEMPADSLAGRTWDWVRVWAEDPDLIRGEDDVKLRRFWAARVVGLLRRFDALGRMLSDRSAIEQRLDEAVLGVASWLTTEYKQPTPAWKRPSAGFGGVRDGSHLFRLVFYVDNIELEHFERQSRVEGQVRREAFRRLREAGAGFPSPRYEVSLLNERPSP
jgi:MscS family membrane protein